MRFDTLTSFDITALSTFNAFIDDFSGWMSIGGAFLGAIGNVMKTVLRGVSKMIGSIQGAIASTLNAAQSIVSSALNFTDSMLSSPCDIASTIGTGVDSILSVCGMAGESVSSGVVGACSGEIRGDVYDLDGTSIPEKLTMYAVRALLNASDIDENDVTSSIPNEQLDNAKAVIDLFKGICINNACRIAVRGEYVSKEKAQQILDDALDYIDTFLLRLGSRSYDVTLSYQALENMRNSFINTMYAIMVDLEQITNYSVPINGNNCLSLAYDKFDNVNRNTEIYEMNKPSVCHPGFLPAGQTITILDS